MRKRLLVAVVAVSTALFGAASGRAQAPSPAAPDGENLWVYIVSDDQRTGAGLSVAHAEPYTGGPWAAVPAAPLPGATVSATRFIARAWHEGETVRVVVSASRQDEQETQVRTAALRPSGLLHVTETERFGARPITLYLVARPR